MINFNLKAFVVALIAAHAHCVHGSDEMLGGIEHTVLNGAYYRAHLQSLTNNEGTKQWIGRLKDSRAERIDKYLKSFTQGKDGDYTDVLDALLLAVDENCSLRKIKSAFSKLVSGVTQEDDKATIIYSCSNALKKRAQLEDVTSIVVERLIPLFKDGLTDLQRSEFMDVFVELLTASNINPFILLDGRIPVDDIIFVIEQKLTEGQQVDSILRSTKKMAVETIKEYSGVDLSTEILTPPPRRKISPFHKK